MVDVVFGCTFALLLLVAACGGERSTENPIVKTPLGSVQGFTQLVDGVEISTFLGIPFAAPPVGSLRWRPPAPPQPWNDTLVATKYSVACPQLPSLLFPPISYSEDCLYLNIFTPPNPPPEGFPVMVWFFGGSYVNGDSSFGLYNGTVLAAQHNVTVVVGNYRLGPIGFLTHPALTSEDPDFPTSGNYGLLDQIQTLNWVQDYISYFGGDYSNVTIFGESAGAGSVCYHLTIPQSQGLFVRAIMESPVCLITNSMNDEYPQGESLAGALGCSASDTNQQILDCMRNATTAQVLDALSSSTFWGPVVDGEVITDSPIPAILNSETPIVPTLLGNNGDEGSLFVLPYYPSSINETEYTEALNNFFHDPTLVPQIYELYNPQLYNGSCLDALVAVLGDYLFVCQGTTLSQLLTHVGTPVYSYLFTHVSAQSHFPPCYGAYHSSELKYVWGIPDPAFDANEIPLSETMQDYWTSFAATGVPSSSTGLDWPQFGAEDVRLVLDLNLTFVYNYNQNNCVFWNNVYFQWS